MAIQGAWWMDLFRFRNRASEDTLINLYFENFSMSKNVLAFSSFSLSYCWFTSLVTSCPNVILKNRRGKGISGQA